MRHRRPIAETTWRPVGVYVFAVVLAALLVALGMRWLEVRSVIEFFFYGVLIPLPPLVTAYFWRGHLRHLPDLRRAMDAVALLLAAALFLLGTVISALEVPAGIKLVLLLGSLGLFRVAEATFTLMLRRSFASAFRVNELHRAKTVCMAIKGMYRDSVRRPGQIASADASTGLAWVHERVGDVEGARKHFCDAVVAYQRAKRPPQRQVLALAGVARTSLLDDPELAKQCARHALEMAAGASDDALMLEVMSSADGVIALPHVVGNRPLLMELYDRRKFEADMPPAVPERVVQRLLADQRFDEAVQVLEAALRDIDRDAAQQTLPEARRMRQWLCAHRALSGESAQALEALEAELVRVGDALRSAARHGSDRELLATSGAASVILRQAAATLALQGANVADSLRVCEAAFAFKGIGFESEATLRRIARSAAGRKGNEALIEAMDETAQEISTAWRTGEDTSAAETRLELMQSILLTNLAEPLPQVVAPDLTEIVAMLASDEMLVECIRGEVHFAQVAYAAYLFFFIGPDGLRGTHVAADAVTLDATVNRVLSALRGSAPEEEGEVAECELTAQIAQPLRRACAGARKLFLSLDGALLTLPMAVLRDAQGQFLLDAFELVNLTSARELLGQSRASTRRGVVISAPRFSIDVPEALAPAEVEPVCRRVGRGALFEELPGAREEGARIAALIGIPNVTGLQASATALRAMRRPAILHLATHAFFIEGGNEFPDVSPTPALSRLQRARDVLLRSGLAMAGSNDVLLGRDVPASVGNGFVFAREIVSMDLEGTTLTTLSACETDLGAQQAGEGLLGLRRAFRVAGAENVLASAWPIDDDATPEVMESFYRELKAGAPIGTALRSAQLQAKARGFAPVHWGAFLVQGTGKATLFARVDGAATASGGA